MAALSAVEVIWPVNADAVDVSHVNAAIADLRYSLLPCGTAAASA
jgi:hypothetical protein